VPQEYSGRGEAAAEKRNARDAWPRAFRRLERVDQPGSLTGLLLELDAGSLRAGGGDGELRGASMRGASRGASIRGGGALRGDSERGVFARGESAPGE